MWSIKGEICTIKNINIESIKDKITVNLGTAHLQ